MVFHLQLFSEYGTSTPAVARTVMQGSKLMQAFPIADDVRSRVNEALFDLQRRLVRCVKIWEEVRDKVEEGKHKVGTDEMEPQSGGSALTIPGVPDLESQAESFLQSAKLAIRDAAGILTHFFGPSFDFRFQRILAWARGAFTENDDLVKCLAHWEPWVKRIVDMRNAVDHPRDEPGGQLVVEDFRLVQTEGGPVLRDPCWYLSGDKPSNVAKSMEKIVEGILRLSEDLLAICLIKNRGNYPLIICEIPEEQRDPACPMRLRVDIRSGPHDA